MDLITDSIANNIKTYLYQLPFISIVVFFIKTLIDNHNVTDLEKILMTNLKKLQVDLSKYLMSSTLIAFIIPITIIANYKEFKEEFEGVPLDVFVNLILLMMIITVVILVFLNALMIKIGNLISPKVTYSVKEKDSNDKWEIIRLSKKDTLLVKNKAGVRKFITNIYDLEYSREESQDTPIFKLYKKKKLSITIIVILLLITIFMLGGVIYTESVFIQLTYYLILLIFLILLMIFSVNFGMITYEERKKKISDNDKSEE